MDWSFFWLESFQYTLGIILKSALVWLPLVLAYLWWTLRLRAIRFRNVVEQKSVVLEIKLAKEIRRSPAAMELFFSQLFQTGAASYLETYVKGKIRPWFSAEIVSIGGAVHFYFWTPEKFRNTIESQIYAQYPDVEIHQVADYTEAVPYDPERISMWGTHFKLTKADAYPIKTYIDYGLDKNDKEEEKIDPLTVMLEYMGALRPGEQCWFQILFQAHKKEGIQEGRLFESRNWRKDAEAEVKKIIAEATPKPEPGSTFKLGPQLTPGQTDTIKAIERSMDKFPFEVMLRGIYLATKEAFNPNNIPGLIGSVRQYNSQTLNGFKLGWFSDHSDLGKDLLMIVGFIPWFANWMAKRADFMRRQVLDAYKKRSIFQEPYRGLFSEPYVLTSEELATIYHLPGGVATTPSLAKIESKRAEPPVNLPV